MIKTFFLSLLLCTTFNGNQNIPPNIEYPVGQFTLYKTTEGYYVEYKGDVDECLTKRFIDKLFEQCDTINVDWSQLDSLEKRYNSPINEKQAKKPSQRI